MSPAGNSIPEEIPILIVARTKMGEGSRCIGALTSGAPWGSIRLVGREGSGQPVSCPLQVGQVWKVKIEPVKSCEPPHLEDRLLVNLGETADYSLSPQKIAQRVPHKVDRHLFVKGDMDILFDGCLRFFQSRTGAAFVGKERVPEFSTQFWRPKCELRWIKETEQFEYGQSGKRIKFKGEQEPPDVIPARTLLRVSLARWWAPEELIRHEDRCYLQLSGWFC